MIPIVPLLLPAHEVELVGHALKFMATHLGKKTGNEPVCAMLMEINGKVTDALKRLGEVTKGGNQ